MPKVKGVPTMRAGKKSAPVPSDGAPVKKGYNAKRTQAAIKGKKK